MSTPSVTATATAGTLIEAVCGGDRGALSRAISAAENDTVAGRQLQEDLDDVSRRALRVGITGPPGAGKSTLIGALADQLIERDRTVGVLFVDPSSPVTGGAVLADRVRIKRTASSRLYARSLGSRGQSGGLAAVTETAIRLLECWGADVVLVETVGAGQSDVDVCRLTDLTMVTCPPGLGDELQAMKAGLMEMADLFVVTKADRPGAGETAASLGHAGHGGRAGDVRTVLRTTATTGDGVPELVDELDRRAATALAAAPVPARRRKTAPAERRHRLFDLDDQVVMVTGATSGLGRRFAEVTHAAGASVVLAGRRAERLRELERNLERSLAVRCDVSDADQRAELLESTVARFGRIDVLVNNAGVSGPPVPAEALPTDRWNETLAVNLSAVFGMAQLAGAKMLEAGSGSIINVASVFGLVANAPVTDAAYAASKGALVNLTRELAAEWAERGVRVNAIAPGWFPSEMTADMVDDESSQRYISRSCPMRRMGAEHELDGILMFLASAASTYCTGQTIAIDGGWTAR